MKKRILGLAGIGMLLAGASFSSAALIKTVTDVDPTTGATVDGTISANEYGAGNTYNYTGSGAGFGGPLGSGTIYMQSDASKLYVGAQINGNLGSNLITVYLDVKTGGFEDTTMSDTGDGGRNVTTNLTRDVTDNFPTGTGLRGANLLADYALQFGNGFTTLFELSGGTLAVKNRTVVGTGGSGAAGSREVSIDWSELGLSNQTSIQVDFFSTLISDTNFSSNEGIPGQGIASNPGFNNSANGGGAVTWANFDRFVAVPEPATAGLLVLGGVAVLLRRRQA